MKADIESLPTAADVGLLCTNLRTIEGRKPLSTEFLDSVFLIPFTVVRFIEIPRESIVSGGPGSMPQIPAGGDGPPSVLVTPPPGEADEKPAEEDVALEDLEPDAELLRRIREA